jgi:hypothetical protein
MRAHPPALISDERVVLRADAPVAPALRRCLAKVPGATGINNHMGSAFSEDPAALGELFAALPGRAWRVLDSRTSPRSQICAVAAQWRVPCAARDVFLDGGPTSAELELRLAAEHAQTHGRAIAIGHPLPSTIAALERRLRNLRDAARHLTVQRLSRAIPERRDVP